MNMEFQIGDIAYYQEKGSLPMTVTITGSKTENNNIIYTILSIVNPKYIIQVKDPRRLRKMLGREYNLIEETSKPIMEENSIIEEVEVTQTYLNIDDPREIILQTFLMDFDKYTPHYPRYRFKQAPIRTCNKDNFTQLSDKDQVIAICLNSESAELQSIGISLSGLVDTWIAYMQQFVDLVRSKTMDSGNKKLLDRIKDLNCTSLQWDKPSLQQELLKIFIQSKLQELDKDDNDIFCNYK